MTLDFRPVQQYFSLDRTMQGDRERLCAMESHFCLKDFCQQEFNLGLLGQQAST